MTYPPPPSSPTPPPSWPPRAPGQPPPRQSSPLVPLLVVGAIAVVMLIAGAAAAIMIVMMHSGAFSPVPPVRDTPPVTQAPPPDSPPDLPAAPEGAAPASAPPRDRPAPPRTAGREPDAPATSAPADRGAAVDRRRDTPADEPVERAVHVGGAIKAPTKIRNVQPVYPQIAQSARVQGIVIIEATIDRSGKITRTRLLKSIPLLDQAALDAVRQWEYEPTLVNGVAVPIIVTVTVNFALH
jgi:protein TonB